MVAMPTGIPVSGSVAMQTSVRSQEVVKSARIAAEWASGAGAVYVPKGA